MRRLARLSGWAAAWVVLEAAIAAEPAVRLVDFDAIVNPITAERITTALDDAEAAGDALVLIRLDTPGGYVESMERIVQRMLAAKVPVVAWVGPSGAKAASAGFFILMAADVAAMAPGTRTGAASTVLLGGDNSQDNVLLRKADQDSAAMVRSIAAQRGRNVEACEQAVLEARAYEEGVALERGLIDFVAKDVDDVLAKLDGHEVRRFDGSVVRVATAGARFVRSEFPWRQRFMEFLASPTVVFLLLLGGTLGLYVEFTHPGVVFPGVAGALCLLLLALAAQAMPVSTVGLLLVLLGFVMFILEVKVTSYGMLTLGGVACLVLGSIMLVEGPIPELRVPLALVVPLSVAVAAVCALAVRLALRAQRHPVRTGVEGLAGERGQVTCELAPEGQVRVHGEIWNAAAAKGGRIARGDAVRVVEVQGLRLLVEPAGNGGGSERS